MHVQAGTRPMYAGEEKKCEPKIPNGNPLPSDPPHANPTLDGKCTGPAAALTCVAGVCDPKDDKCGLLDGSPCDPNGTQCRTAQCLSGIYDGPKLDGGAPNPSTDAIVLEGGGCSCNSSSNAGGSGLTTLGAIAVLSAMRRRRR